MNSRQAISWLRTWVEDRVLTAPSGAFRPGLWGCDERTVAQKAAELERTGYISLGSIIGGGDLAAIAGLIDEAVAGRLSGVKAQWSEKVTYWRILNPLRLHPVLLTAAAHPMALAVCEAYLRRHCYLGDVDLRRVMPIRMEELQSGGYS